MIRNQAYQPIHQPQPIPQANDRQNFIVQGGVPASQLMGVGVQPQPQSSNYGYDQPNVQSAPLIIAPGYQAPA